MSITINAKWPSKHVSHGCLWFLFFSVTYRDPFVYHCSRPIRMIYKCIRFNYIGCSSFHHCVLQDSICNVFGACKSFLNGALRKTLQTFSFENICGSLRRLQIFSKRRPPPPRAAPLSVSASDVTPFSLYCAENRYLLLFETWRGHRQNLVSIYNAF